jgi:predicted O-methyltransferase YrrM
MARHGKSQIEKYFTSLTNNDNFAAIRASADVEIQEILISPFEGKLIHTLLRTHKSVNVLEIGTCVGYSTAWIASALPAGGQVVSIEKDAQRHELAVKNLADIDNVHLLCADAKEALQEMVAAGRSFDAVFIDANKGGYPEYLELADQLLTSGGLIIADNALLFGDVFKESDERSRLGKKMHQFNQQLVRNYDAIIIPTDEGLAVGVKR